MPWFDHRGRVVLRRWFAAALVSLGACRIPADHFIGTGGDGDGGNGGDGGGTGDGLGNADAAVASSKGYLIDSNSGIFRINKSPTGTLSLGAATPVAIQNLQSAVVNRQGTHLLAIQGNSASTSRIHDLSIAGDGSLTAGISLPLNNCFPRFSTLHPSGNFIAIGCTNANLSIVKLDANGALNTTLPVDTFPVGVSPMNPVFSSDGNCLFAADPGANQDRVVSFRFDPNTGSVSMTAGANMPASATGIAAHPTRPFIYVAGIGSAGVVAFQHGPNCNLNTVNTQAGGPTSLQAVVTPGGDRLYVTGGEVYGFDIANSGATLGSITPLLGSPSLQGESIDGAIFDPGLPNILYGTNLAAGTYPITIKPGDGSLSKGTPVTGGNNNRWFAMAP